MDDFNRKLANFGFGLFVAAVLALLIWGVFSLEAWRWHECRKVGHGVAYCVMLVGGH